MGREAPPESRSVSEAGTEGRELECQGCRKVRIEHSAWTADEQLGWSEHFPSTAKEVVTSDADSEGSKTPCDKRRAPSRSQPGSGASSSDPGFLTADEEPGREDDGHATLAAVSLLKGEVTDASETIDDEEKWVNPMYWDCPLARHASWFTVHAVVALDRLLCGRVKDGAFESIVNPPAAHPVCKVCRASVRGAVERRRMETAEKNHAAELQENSEDSGSEGGESEMPVYSPEPPADEDH